MDGSRRTRILGLGLGLGLALGLCAGCGAERFMRDHFDRTLGSEGNPPQPVSTHTRTQPRGT